MASIKLIIRGSGSLGFFVSGGLEGAAALLFEALVVGLALVLGHALPAGVDNVVYFLGVEVVIFSELFAEPFGKDLEGVLAFSLFVHLKGRDG